MYRIEFIDIDLLLHFFLTEMQISYKKWISYANEIPFKIDKMTVQLKNLNLITLGWIPIDQSFIPTDYCFLIHWF